MICDPPASDKRTSMHTLPSSTAPEERRLAAIAATVTRSARGLLVLLAALLPFEAPLCRVGPLQLTTVEFVLYATLAVWGLAVVARAAASVGGGGLVSRARRVMAIGADPTLIAAGAWIAVVFTAAIAAPSYRGAALKFALRTTSGVLAFLVARDLGRDPATRRRILLALAAGGTASAATAAIEAGWPQTAPLWSIFRAGAFDALGLQRSSGVFAYPTIGAMYWEAVLPLAIVAPFGLPSPSSERPTRRAIAFALAAIALLVGAILASATRSGLVGAVIGCAVLATFGRRTGTRLPRLAGAALGVTVASVAFVFVHPESRLAERLRFWQDASWLRADYSLGAVPQELHAGAPFREHVKVHNDGVVTWRRDGPQPTRLSYHWEPLGVPASLADYEGLRTVLPIDVGPGEWVDVVAAGTAPDRPGAYRLCWDLVQEGVAWFSERGNPTASQLVTVTEPLGHPPPSSAHTQTPAPVSGAPQPARPALWRAALALWRARPLLGVGPDNFRRRYEAVLPSPNGRPYTDTRLHANSLYFETLADTGLCGLIALAALGLALLARVRDHAAALCIDGFAFGVAAALFFVHGALDYFFEFTPLFGLFWLLLGLTSGATSGPPPHPPGARAGTPP